MNKGKMRGIAVAGLCGAALALVANLVRPASPADYVNVALVPALAEEIGADLPTRLAVAHEGATLLRMLSASPSIAGDAADERGQRDVAAAGQRVFDLLSVEERKAFFRIFRSGEAARVTYRTMPPPGGEGFALFILTFGWPDAGGGEGASISAVQRELDRAWEAIPSAGTARELEHHPHEGVQKAATTWLARHAPPKKARTTASFEERRRQMREGHEERVAQMKADFEQRRSRNSDPEREKRVREMRERHDRRVQEARAARDSR